MNIFTEKSFNFFVFLLDIFLNEWCDQNLVIGVGARDKEGVRVHIGLEQSLSHSEQVNFLQSLQIIHRE